MKKIEMFTRYSAIGASSRYRFYKYIMPMLREGYDVEVFPFFNDDYLEKLYSGERLHIFKILRCYCRRFFASWRAERELLIEYELLPFVPWFLEKWLLRRKKYILNFDDNVWDKYRDRPLLKNKYTQLCAHASGVIVANEYLFRKVCRVNDNVIKIPTALDPEPYQYEAEKFERFTLVWIGTPVTYKFIRAFAPMFRKLAERIDYELLIVARKELESDALRGVNMRFLNWSEDGESFILPKAHVGIMPLTHDSFAKGKSSFKIFQYFASGLPVVASPVGENRHVIENGVNGFLPRSDKQWVEQIAALAEDQALYQRMAEESANSAADYSLDYWIPEMLNFMERTFKL